MKEKLNNKLHLLLNTQIEKSYQVTFSAPKQTFRLHGKFKRLVISSDGCRGYTGHCSCLNNPCKICSNMH